MKTIKKVLLLISTTFFLLIPSIANADHCSGKRGTEWFVCNAGGDSSSSSSSSTSTKKKSKSSGKSLLQKIKEMGGKKVGEEG